MGQRVIIVTLLVIGVGLWLALRLPARVQPNTAPPAAVRSTPRLAVLPSAPHSAPEAAGAKLARAFKGETDAEAHKLNSSEIGDYLNANQYNALSLVTAFAASGDKEFLKQAAKSYPNDPLVQAKVLMHDLFPEERQKWLEAMKSNDPENSLPHLLAATDLMKNGDVKGAMAEISSASNKSYNDYTRESGMGLEEAYLSAGRNVAEAKAFGSSEILLPHLAPIKEAASKMAEAANAMAQSGDKQGAAALLNATYAMGKQFRDSAETGGILLSDLVGLAIENIALTRWPEGVEAPFGNPHEQIKLNKDHRAEAQKLSAAVDAWLPNAPDNEIINYFDRLRTYGEWNAVNWLKTRHPELVPADPP
jgi:hypothetical protein